MKNVIRLVLLSFLLPVLAVAQEAQKDTWSPLSISSSSSLYEELGISPDAKPREIKRAYRKLAAKCHPDKFANKSGSPEYRMIEERFQKIAEAYSILSDETKKEQYDEFLKTGGFSQQPFLAQQKIPFINQMAALIHKLFEKNKACNKIIGKDLLTEDFPLSFHRKSKRAQLSWQEICLQVLRVAFKSSDFCAKNPKIHESRIADKLRWKYGTRCNVLPGMYHDCDHCDRITSKIDSKLRVLGDHIGDARKILSELAALFGSFFTNIIGLDGAGIALPLSAKYGQEYELFKGMTYEQAQDAYDLAISFVKNDELYNFEEINTFVRQLSDYPDVKKKLEEAKSPVLKINEYYVKIRSIVNEDKRDKQRFKVFMRLQRAWISFQYHIDFNMDKLRERRNKLLRDEKIDCSLAEVLKELEPLKLNPAYFRDRLETQTDVFCVDFQKGDVIHEGRSFTFDDMPEKLLINFLNSIRVVYQDYENWNVKGIEEHRNKMLNQYVQRFLKQLTDQLYLSHDPENLSCYAVISRLLDNKLFLQNHLGSNHKKYSYFLYTVSLKILRIFFEKTLTQQTTMFGEFVKPKQWNAYDYLTKKSYGHDAFRSLKQHYFSKDTLDISLDRLTCLFGEQEGTEKLFDVAQKMLSHRISVSSSTANLLTATVTFIMLNHVIMWKFHGQNMYQQLEDVLRKVTINFISLYGLAKNQATDKHYTINQSDILKKEKDLLVGAVKNYFQKVKASMQTK